MEGNHTYIHNRIYDHTRMKRKFGETMEVTARFVGGIHEIKIDVTRSFLTVATADRSLGSLSLSL